MYTNASSMSGGIGTLVPSPSINKQAAPPQNIGDIAVDAEKYTLELLSDLTRIADSLAGANQIGNSECAPSPAGLIYMLQSHRSTLAAMGEQIWRIKQVLGL